MPAARLEVATALREQLPPACASQRTGLGYPHIPQPNLSADQHLDRALSRSRSPLPALVALTSPWLRNQRACRTASGRAPAHSLSLFANRVL